MKNFVRSGSVLVALLCPVLVVGRASATVVWTATFEKNKSGDVCSSGAAGAEFSPGINETKGTRINAEVLGEQVYSGSLACKVTVHPDDTFTFGQNRVDIHHQSTLTDEGKDSYLSGHYMMPADAQVRNEIGFYESNKSNNAMDLWVAPKTGGGTTINFAIGFLPMTASWTADFKVGVWHQIGIHVHWSQNATLGFVDLWLDGVKTVTMLKGQTRPDTTTLYYQTGLHRRNTYQVTDTIYFDDFYEGDTEADMHLAAPGSGGGSDGGAPSADGGGGAGASGSGGATGTGGMTGAGGTGGAGGSTGTAGSGSTGAAGSGSAGSGSTGAAGAAAGAAGSNSAGTAGSGSTGAAGSSSTGAVGTSGTHASKSGGCAVAGEPGPGALTIAALALLGAIVARRRRC
jgi:MYXO-CTERM domain-containing protein